MAEIFIPKVFQLTDIALEKIQERVNLVVGAEDEVRKLSEKLKTLEEVLYDAERRRVEDDGVGRWLEELDDIAYEMEDVLEEWNIKIVKTPMQKHTLLEEETPMQKHTLLEKVRLYIQSFCSCLKQVPLRSEFALKIKEINDKLDSTLKEAKKYRLIARAPTQNPFAEFKNPVTIPDVDESKVHGRENDKNTLLQYLLSESHTNDNQNNRLKVVSIVGFGGSGKTTLAQLLFNDERVSEHFNLKNFLCFNEVHGIYILGPSLNQNVGEIPPRYLTYVGDDDDKRKKVAS